MSSPRYTFGVVPVPLPQVITGWRWVRSFGRNIVYELFGPTMFSVTVANGPILPGSAAGQVPGGPAGGGGAAMPPVAAGVPATGPTGGMVGARPAIGRAGVPAALVVMPATPGTVVTGRPVEPAAALTLPAAGAAPCR